MGKSMLLGALLVATTLSGCEDSACERVVSRASECGIPLAEGVCDDGAWDCRLACLTGRGCASLRTYFDGDGLPPEDRRCMTACGRFACGDGTDIAGGGVCDGTQDCENGADERDCVYMSCADGMVIHERGSCEERDARFSRLTDASDEDAGGQGASSGAGDGGLVDASDEDAGDPGRAFGGGDGR